ncbi:aldehyde dehydrogenase (NADP(+)) [Nakamurella sp. UYEF19]|uniref:aldehyde dehydrogenase (NADP(+)) n=1 Tax=Nakamurella sp. UYEF19 TaxID=1756392 RepID=UPI0033924B90
MLTTTADPTVTAVVDAAAAAAEVWAATTPAQRRRALDAVADSLDAHVDELVRIAIAETHLGEPRLRGEVKRTSFQLRLFGEVLADGAFLDAQIDHADPQWPMGAPRPDLRRVLEPVGPVVIFAASNFPFAFSVAGGDTASALAAGCPVILKAHPGHPALSVLTARLVTAALADAGAPDGVFALIVGDGAGRQALTDPRVKAGSFTGSIAGGRALFDLANSRPEPIPFFAEMGSVNPVFVTAAAAELRAEAIARGLLDSFTLGAGQFCTKPGVVLVPEKSSVIEHLVSMTLPAPAPMLNSRIQAGYTAVLADLADHPEVSVLAGGPSGVPTNYEGEDPPGPTILVTGIAALLADPDTLLTECFGPTVLLVTYSDESELLAAARSLDGQLTATIAGEPDDAVVPELVRLLAGKAGRLLWNQWPTGVSVTHAQQHGGPYPATTAPSSTSVGTAAITRFLRPVAYQGFPTALLPAALQDSNAEGIPQRVDGVLVQRGSEY